MPTTPRPPASRVRTRVLLVVLLVVFVNLPLAHSTWTRSRVESSGVATTAEVVGTDVQGAGDDQTRFVQFRYPAEVDPGRTQYAVAVDEAAFDEADRTGEIEVRHLADRPSAYVVEGEQRGSLGIVITVLGDAILVVILLLAWRYGGRRRPWLRMAAVEDVERCLPGVALERIAGTLYLARGEVSGIEDGEIVLDLGDRDLHVVLDGHANPVGYQQPAQVRGRMID